MDVNVVLVELVVVDVVEVELLVVPGRRTIVVESVLM